MSTTTTYHYMEFLPDELAPGPYTIDDYMSLPEGEPVELILGNLVMSPAPRVSHQVIVTQLVVRLSACAATSRALAVVSPVDVIFSDIMVLQPDVVYLSEERRGIVGSRINGPPDIAVEVLSPSHKARDRKHKLAIYAEHGVPEYWIVDPQARDTEFLLLKDGQYSICLPAEGVYTSPRLPEVTINVAEFWDRAGELLA